MDWIALFSELNGVDSGAESTGSPFPRYPACPRNNLNVPSKMGERGNANESDVNTWLQVVVIRQCLWTLDYRIRNRIQQM